MKLCNKCKEVKDRQFFYKDKAKKDWLYYCCKECDKLRHRTEVWLISLIFRSQKKHSKRRWHTPPSYTKEELSIWVLKQELFHNLFAKRAKSWYKTRLSPSIDRIDDYRWYSLDNINLMTRWENDDKWHRDSSKAVKQFNKEWEFIKKYCSAHKASRETWVNRWDISSCCLCKLISAWSFKREYV